MKILYMTLCYLHVDIFDDAYLNYMIAHVVELMTVRLMLIIAVQRKWKVHQITYSAVLLQQIIECEVHTCQHLNSLTKDSYTRYWDS